MPIDFTAIQVETGERFGCEPLRGRTGAQRRFGRRFGDVLRKPPPGYQRFDAGNIRVHGIHPSDVEDGIEFAEALDRTLAFIGSRHYAGRDSNRTARDTPVNDEPQTVYALYDGEKFFYWPLLRIRKC
jgi:DNA polymerase III epsilon subunit-like protein